MKIIAKAITPLTLSHKSYCEKIGACRCSQAMVSSIRRNPVTGDKNIGVRAERFPPVVTLLANRPEDLPDAVADLPNVKNLIRAGALRIVR